MKWVVCNKYKQPFPSTTDATTTGRGFILARNGLLAVAPLDPVHQPQQSPGSGCTYAETTTKNDFPRFPQFGLSSLSRNIPSHYLQALLMISRMDTVHNLFDHHHPFVMGSFLIPLPVLILMTTRTTMVMITTQDAADGMNGLLPHLHPSPSLQPALPNA